MRDTGLFAQLRNPPGGFLVNLLSDGTTVDKIAGWHQGMRSSVCIFKMGVRSQRYALVAQNGKVTYLAVEPPGGFDASRAESVLAHIST